MKIKIENFRSFIDTNYISLKPITVLIGKNSSGKSTFLRSFPLMKQSVEEKSKAPILLYGRYVDFGSYSDIKPNIPNHNKPFKISFILDEIRERFTKRYLSPTQVKCVKCNIEFAITFEEDKKQSLYTSIVDINILNNTHKIRIDHKKLQVDNIEANGRVLFDNSDEIHLMDTDEFCPEFYNLVKFRRRTVPNDEIYRSVPFSKLIRTKIIQILKNFSRVNTSNETLWSIVSRITIDTDENILEQLKNDNNPKIWLRKISLWTINSKPFVILKSLLIAYYIHGYLLNNINTFLKYFSLNVKYLAPLRATAERYYRIQQLAVNEVDPNGKNLPMFLDSLSERQMKAFNRWTKNNFGFFVNIHKLEGHYSIKIGHNESSEANLSDIGFGYSQILPILTQIWHSTLNARQNLYRYSEPNEHTPQIIAIEQPELHLHPEFQARFVDAISKIIKDMKNRNSSNLILLIETHSDVIINRLGECIQDKEISSEDVEIAIFNKEDNSPISIVTNSSFDEEGNLKDWPFGFFLPSIK